MYEIFAYWNSDDIRAVLNGIAMTMNGPDYLGLMKALAIGAILVAVGTAIARMKGEEPLAYFVMLALFYGTLFVPKATVSINDLRAAKVYTVANVPLGLAFFASTTSHIGHWLTETYETNFTAVDDLRFAQNGMAFGARLVYESQKLKISTPSLNNDLIQFTMNCINPELVNSPATIDVLTQSTDIWGTIGGNGGGFSLNPGRSTIVASIPYTCDNAYNRLNATLNAEAALQMQNLGMRLNPANAFANTIISSQLPSVEAAILDISRSAQDSIKQSMMANLMAEAQPAIAAINGNGQAASVALAVAQAEQSTIVSYASMAKIAESALPKIRNSIELLILALFPIVFLLVIVAGAKAGMVLKSYLMGMFWVQLWAPIYAVINFMMNKSDAMQFKAIISSQGGTTMGNMGRLTESALSASSVAGLLTISVPMIAYAIVKGGEMAMSSAVGQLMSPAQGAAQKAGDAVGQGNISGGNVQWGNAAMNNSASGGFSSNQRSWDSTSANMDSRSDKSSDPHMSTYTGANGSITRNGAGDITSASVGGFNVGGAVSGSTSMGRSNASSSSESVKAAQNWSHALDQSSGSTSSSSSAATFMHALSSAVNSQTSTGTRHGQQWSAGRGSASSTESGGSRATQNQETGRFTTELGGGASSPTAKSGGGGGGKDGKGASQGSSVSEGGFGAIKAAAGFGTAVTQALMDQAFNKTGNTNSQDQKYAANVLSENAKSIASSTGDQSVRQAAQAFTQDLQNAVRSTSSSGASLTKGSEASQTRQDSTNNSAGGEMKTGKPVFDQMMKNAGADLSDNKSVDAALGGANNAQTLTAATQAAASDYKKQEGEGWTGQGGAKGPRSMQSVESQGRAGVASSQGGGAGAVSSHNAAGSAKVSSLQPTSATGSPDTGSVEAGYAKGATGAHNSYQAAQRTAQVNGGADIAAAGLYADNQGGTGTLLKNAFLGGMGYVDQTATASQLKDAAVNNHALANQLQGIQARGMATPAEREYVAAQLTKYHDNNSK